jgi:hypothetical protein
MKTYDRTKMRKELDELLLPFRMALLLSRSGWKRKSGLKGGWLRSLRDAIWMPVDEMARRMGVQRSAVHRMERAEQSEGTQLATLRRAA